MKKRFLVVLLSAALILSLSVQTFANDFGEVTEEAATEETTIENKSKSTEEESQKEEDPEEEEIAEITPLMVNASKTTKTIKIIKEAKIETVEAVIFDVDSLGTTPTLSGTYFFDKDVELETIDVENGALTMIIKDGVTVMVDAEEMEGAHAGITVSSSDAPLTITGGTDDGTDPKGTGVLYAYGTPGSAGIGGKHSSAGGYTTIEACTIYAYGGGTDGTDAGGPGIGGGYLKDTCDITINGGKVYAHGGLDSAGIGSGVSSNTTEGIVINGGTVYAYGNGKGSGIGGGKNTCGADITICQKFDGVETYVEARAGNDGAAGIGGGNGARGYDITITGGTVYAYGSACSSDSTSGGAGIGGGNKYKTENITISDDPNDDGVTTVYAYGRGGGAGIGGGSHHGTAVENIKISGGIITAISEADGSSSGCGAGIGGGSGGNAQNIYISGGTITATSENEGAGIGAGADANLKDDKVGVEITGGYIVATSADGGAGIGGGYKGDAAGITISGSDTAVYATANNGAGIGGGSQGGKGKNITIDEGYVIAKSLGAGAGIGSGKNQKSSDNIRINGGYVEAYGGGPGNVWGDENGCGIGAGAKDTTTSIPNDKIYISTSLEITHQTNGVWSSPDPNDGSDLAHYGGINYMKNRVVKVSNGAERKITLGDQSTVAVYHTPESAVYTAECKYISGTGWSFTWYADAEGTVERSAPSGITTAASTTECTVTNSEKTPAGTYYFAVSCAGVKSNIVSYRVDKLTATITTGGAVKVYDGTPLTCSDYEMSGFAEGEGVSVTCIGSCTGSPDQTEPSIEPNICSYTANIGTDLKNYNIFENFGMLVVVREPFVVEGSNYNGKYDGNQHAFSVKVSGKNGTDLTSQAIIEYSSSADGTTWSDWTAAAPEIKDAGTLYVKARATVKEVTLSSAVYTMTVTKRNITLTSASAEKEYDGTALTDRNVTISGDGFAGTESFKTLKGTGSITRKGSTSNTIEYTFGTLANPDNYNIKEVKGILKITPKSVPITITTQSFTKTYDGTAIETGAAEYTSGVLVNNDRISITLLRTGGEAVKDAGTYNNDIEYFRVKNREGIDVTDCYTFDTPVIGTLRITQRDITLTSGSAWKVFDNTPLTKETVTVTGDGFAGNEQLAYSDFASLTEASYNAIDNTFRYAPVAGSGFDESNYQITVAYGKLMVVEEIGILAKNQEFTYDGTSHEAPAQLVAAEGGLAGKLEYSTSTDNITWTDYSETVPSLKDAGTLFVKVKATKGGQSATGSYTVKVDKRKVTITSGSAVKTYDSTDLTCDTYEIGGEGFAEGEGADIATFGFRKLVGSSENTFLYELNDNTKEENYSIDTEFGTLTVKKDNKPIVIKTASDSRTYNGDSLNNNGYVVTWGGTTLTSGNLYGADSLSVVTTGTITDVGTASNTCNYRVVCDGKDVTDCYTFGDVSEGTLEITKRSVVISTSSAQKIYDGTALTDNGYTLSGDGFISGQGFAKVNVSGTITNAGTAVNILNAENPYTFKEGTNADNYEVSVINGTLTVKKRNVTVSSGSAVSTWSACGEGGLSNSACTVSGDGFVEGETGTGYPKGITVLASPEAQPENEVSAENEIGYGWTGNGNPANYSITECLGTLKIVNNSKTAAVATDYAGLYDGKPHSGSVAVTIENPDTIQYSVDGGTNWLNEQPSYTDVKLNEDDEVEAYEVKVKITKGMATAECTFKVTINPRTVKLTAGSASRVYDGTNLTCGDYTITGDGFVSGEQPAIKMTEESSIKDAGTAVNEVKALQDDNAKGFKRLNYSITYENGTLEVTKRQAYIYSLGFGGIEGAPEKLVVNGTEYDMKPVTYDGTAHKREVVVEVGKGQVEGIEEIYGMGFVDGEGLEYSNFATATDAGLYENSFSWKEKIGTNLANYDLKVTFGLMKVVPREVVLASANVQKLFDGTPLTNEKIIVGGDKFAAGEEPEYYVTGRQITVGASYNTFHYVFNESMKEINYKITKVEGTLMVYENNTLRLVVPDNKEYVYDGMPHGDEAKAFIGETPCSDTIWYSTDGGKEWKNEAPQLTDAGTLIVKAYVDKSGYVRSEGTYTITVTEADGLGIEAPATTEFKYDGNPHGDPAIAYLNKKLCSDARISYSTDGGKTWSETVPQLTNNGTLHVTAKASLTNYKDVTVTYTLTVKNVPGTGDNNNMTLWTILAAAAVLLGLAGIAGYRRRTH